MSFPFVLPNRVYEQLKWFVTIVLPAFGTFYVTLGDIWGLPNPSGVAATTLAVATLFGVILGISSHQYNKTDAADGQIVVTEVEDGSTYSLQLEKSPEELAKMKRVTFRVDQGTESQ